MFVPLPSHNYGEPLRWQLEADFGFPMAGGYFVGPGTFGRGSHDPSPRFTTEVLRYVWATGEVPWISDTDRLRFINDLRYWKADAVVLPHTNRDAELYKVMAALFSSDAEYVGDVWVWRFDL